MSQVKCGMCKRYYDNRVHAFCPKCQDVTSGEGVADYVGGHTNFTASGVGKLIVNQDGISFYTPREGKRFTFGDTPAMKFDYDKILSITIESRGEIEKKVSAGMVAAFGLIGFAFPKKERGITYLTINYPIDDKVCTIIFGSTVGHELVNLANSYLGKIKKEEPDDMKGETKS